MAATTFTRTTANIAIIEQYLSKDRFATYVQAARNDRVKALEHYEVNTLFSEALYGPLQTLEVALRNAINSTLSAEMGRDDWYDLTWLGVKEANKVSEAKNRLVPRFAPAPTTPTSAVVIPSGQVVATLSFGFWVSLLTKFYHRSLWRPHLHKAFPNGNPTNDEVRDTLRNLSDLRNRIAHHEPILFRLVHGKLVTNNPGTSHAEIMKAIGWICPTVQAWARDCSRYNEVVKNLKAKTAPPPSSPATP